eukprot:gb/GECG01013536.1/.p1 GENE.gb/GECG01013536.1/~~gb/GECG01013536.1/.p1  ORF type:complete len:907 (+),score=106.69 gb/GECG01013536.1/:1-2721(+)
MEGGEGTWSSQLQDATTRTQTTDTDAHTQTKEVPTEPKHCEDAASTLLNQYGSSDTTSKERATLVSQLQELLEKEKRLMHMKVMAKDHDLAKLEEENYELRNKISQLGHPYKENADDTQKTGPVRTPLSIRNFKADVFEELTAPYKDSVHPAGPHVLDLTGDKLEQVRDIPATVEACLNVPGIEGIDLSNSNYLADEDLPKLCEILSRYPQVKYIRLADNAALGKTTAKTLSQWLPRLPQLRSLDVSGNWFNGYSFSVPPEGIPEGFLEGLGIVVTALKKCTHLQHLGISICDDFGEDALLESQNTAQGQAEQEKPRKGAKKGQNQSSKQQGSTKTKSKHGKHNTRQGSSRHLCDSLCSLTCLKSLSLRGSRISSLGFRVLLNPEVEQETQESKTKTQDSKTKTQQESRVSKSKAGSKPQQTSASVSGVQWVRCMRSLAHLDLSFTYMGWKGVRHLIKALGYSMLRSKTEDCRLLSLQSLDLRGCSLQDAFADLLFTALCAHITLKRVDLRYNEIADKGLDSLITQLDRQSHGPPLDSKTCGLRVLDLRNNAFESDWSPQLVTSAIRHPTLVHVTGDGVSGDFMFRDDVDSDNDSLRPLTKFENLWECDFIETTDMLRLQSAARTKGCKIVPTDQVFTVSKLFEPQRRHSPVFACNENMFLNSNEDDITKVFTLTASSTCVPSEESASQVKHSLQWRMSFGVSGYAISGKQMATESVKLYFRLYFRDLASESSTLLYSGSWEKDGAPSQDHLRAKSHVESETVEPSVLGIWYDNDIMHEGDPQAHFAIGWPFHWFRVELDPDMLCPQIWDAGQGFPSLLPEIGTFEVAVSVVVDKSSLCMEHDAKPPEDGGRIAESDSIKLPRAAAESVVLVSDAQQCIEPASLESINEEAQELSKTGMHVQPLQT